MWSAVPDAPLAIVMFVMFVVSGSANLEEPMTQPPELPWTREAKSLAKSQDVVEAVQRKSEN